MTTRIRSTKQHTKMSNPSTQSNPHSKESTMTTATKTTSSTQSVPTTNPADVIFVTPPPADANIPSPPVGWVPPTGVNYRAIKPKHVELSAMPDAVIELTKFVDYATTIGKTAPPHQELIQMFDAASQWSTMRISAAAWDAYCSAQEGTIWTRVRDQMTRMKPAFALAVRGDPSLASKYPKLATLLDAKTAIARKAVSTRRANKVAVAEGKPPTHGAIGKKRKRAADKAMVVQAEQAAQAAHAPPPAGGGTTAGTAAVNPVVAPTPKVDVAPPQAPAASPAPAPSPQPQATNGATNGASQNGTAHA